MNIDWSEEGMRDRERSRLTRMSLDLLQKLLGELYEKRYIEQDINYESYYRLASSVYLQRSRGVTSYKFHLKNFLG